MCRLNASRGDANVAVEVQTGRGRCETHGTVEAVRQIPKAGFPFLITAARRSMAKSRPFRCPTCNEPVEVE